MPSMFIGGAEKALLGLLEAIDYSLYDISLFLYRHEGEFLSYIPETVHVLPALNEYSNFDTPIWKVLCSRYWRFGIARIVSKIAKKIHCLCTKEHPGIWMSMQYTSRFLLPFLPPIPGEYDTGVMFLGVSDVLVKKVNAKKKIAWNHTDYEILGPDVKYDSKVYKSIDHIVSVSPLCTSQLLKIYPELTDKAITISNISSKKMIQRLAEESIEEALNGKYKLLSVGRFSYAKNFDNIPDICRHIRRKGIDVVWYLIGYGGDEQLIRQKIVEAGMQDYVKILGKKENPYPYMKKCDLYVQPSRYEGKCISVVEAQVLARPVVITAYPTAESQLINGYDGLIVPMDNEGCANEIVKLLRDPQKMEQFSCNCGNEDYTGEKDIKIINKIMF